MHSTSYVTNAIVITAGVHVESHVQVQTDYPFDKGQSTHGITLSSLYKRFWVSMESVTCSTRLLKIAQLKSGVFISNNLESEIKFVLSQTTDKTKH